MKLYTQKQIDANFVHRAEYEELQRFYDLLTKERDILIEQEQANFLAAVNSSIREHELKIKLNKALGIVEEPIIMVCHPSTSK